MIITDDIDNDSTISANRAIGLRIPEQTFVQLIGSSLANIREDLQKPGSTFIDDVFSRLPVKTRDNVKQWLLDNKNIFIGLNWPTEALHLPFIVVVTESESEDESNAVTGDVGGMLLGGGMVYEHRTIPLTCTVSVIIAADDPSMVIYLGALLRLIFSSNKDDLTRHTDVHDLSITQQDIRLEERFVGSPAPVFGRSLTLRYKTYFDFNVKTSIINVIKSTIDVNGVTVSGDEQ